MVRDEKLDGEDNGWGRGRTNYMGKEEEKLDEEKRQNGWGGEGRGGRPR